jgi:hypothetical protein
MFSEFSAMTRLANCSRLEELKTGLDVLKEQPVH